MKKLVSLILALVMVMAMFAACAKTDPAAQPSETSKSSGAEGTSPATNESTPSSNAEPVTIRIAMWGDEARAEAFQQTLAPWAEANNVTVQIELAALSEYYDKLSTQLGAGTAPDIFWVSDAREGTFISSGWCANLRSTLEADPDWDIDDFYDGVLEATDYVGDGGIYGVPLSFGVRAIFWNKTLFEEAGLKTPQECWDDGTWTYETMFDLAAKIHEYDSTKIGVKTWPVNQSTNGVQNWADMLMAYGANIVNSDSTEFTLDSEAGYKVTQMVYDAMFTTNAHAKPGDETAFVSGNVAMSRETYSYMKNMVNGEVDFEWDLVPLPYGDAGKDATLYTDYAFWCANAYGEHKDLAMDLIRFVTMPEAQLEWCKTFMPPRKSVMNSELILNPGEGYPSAEHIKAAFVDSIEERPLSRYTGTTEWTLFCTTVQQYYEMIWAGAYNVEDGIAAMKSECEQYLNH